MLLSRALFLVLCIALVLDTASAKPKKKNRRFDRHVDEHKVSKESILANRRTRKMQLQGMILDARQKLADHSAGTAKLSDKEKEELERTVDLFQRKLDDLSKDIDPKEWELILRREHRHAERRRRNREQHEEL